MVLFGQKWLYSAESKCIRSDCIRAKVVVFGQSGCIRAKWLFSGTVVVKVLYSGKSGVFKVVVLGEKGCREKWFLSGTVLLLLYWVLFW